MRLKAIVNANDSKRIFLSPSTRRRSSFTCIFNNDSKFCLALNHLAIIGKYFLYVKALNGKCYIFDGFVSLARDKIKMENLFLVRLVAKKSSEQNGLFFRLF